MEDTLQNSTSTMLVAPSASTVTMAMRWTVHHGQCASTMQKLARELGFIHLLFAHVNLILIWQYRYYITRIFMQK